MAESPVTVVKGGTLAQNIIGSAPEGMLIAPSWKRVLAFMLDMMLITIVLGFFTDFRLLEGLFDYTLLTAGSAYTVEFFMNWFVFCAAFYLYFKYTGQKFGRSLGQRGFRIAIVHDNGTMLEKHHWGPRSVSKMIYIIPFVGWLWFGLRDTFSAGSKTAEYRTAVDLKNHTVAAVDWSLPSETRLRLR